MPIHPPLIKVETLDDLDAQRLQRSRDVVGTILGRAPLYRYADPMGALNLAVMVAGDELGWHFDQTDFVVSIALQSSLRGGDFESANHVRDPGDERFDVVAGVLAGERPDLVETVPMTPGTLMLYMLRFWPRTSPSIHRHSFPV